MCYKNISKPNKKQKGTSTLKFRNQFYVEKSCITSPRIMSFCHNTDEKNPCWVYCLCGVYTFMLDKSMCLNCSIVSMVVCESTPWDEMVSCPGLVSTFCSVPAGGDSRHPQLRTRISGLENN